MNNKSPGIPNFDLYLINRDGSGLEQITWDEGFDAFPMFSNDGKKVVWASSRNGAKEGDIDIFIADWVE
jgi:Tol biopolymer transport system component